MNEIILDRDWILYLPFISLRIQVHNRKLDILFLRYGLRYITSKWVEMGQRKIHTNGGIEGSSLSSRSVGYWKRELFWDEYWQLDVIVSTQRLLVGHNILSIHKCDGKSEIKPVLPIFILVWWNKYGLHPTSAKVLSYFTFLWSRKITSWSDKGWGMGKRKEFSGQDPNK
jgi:hypothetical protein